MGPLKFELKRALISVLFIVITISTGFVNPLKIQAPSRTQTTSAPTTGRNDGGLNLPYIHLLNGTSGELGGDPIYYNPLTIGAATLFQNDTVYVVPETRNVISFQCEASYPVFWNLAHSKLHANVYNALRVISTRKFDDPFDPSTFTYVTILTMNGPNPKLTGNYSCQSAARHEIQSSVFLFWESTFGSVLVLSKENLTVTINSDTEDINLPCHVTDPDAHPTLFKVVESPAQLHQPWIQKNQQLALNDSISFSPTTGFTLKKLPNPLGTYKCSLDEKDYITIEVLHKKDSNPSSSSESNYTFIYDEDSKQVRCCAKSGGKKPPKLFMMICEHPSTCGLREFLVSNGNTYYPWNQGRRRASCSVLSLKAMHTGVVRCVGDGGYNVYKEFIVPVRIDITPWNRKRNTTTYFRWEEIDPQEMIAVGFPSRHGDIYVDMVDTDGGIAGSPRKLQTDHTIYSEQSIQLGCHMSRYYFASGNYWMVRWKNQTMTQLDADSVSKGTPQYHSQLAYMGIGNRHSNMISFVANSEMESVICFGPVWNSSIWITKIHYLYVNESLSPFMLSGAVNETVHYTWYANETEKILTCSSSGLPSPMFHWEKDNETITESSHNYHMFQPNVTNLVSTTPVNHITTTTTTEAAPTTDGSLSDGGSVGGDDIEDNQTDDNNNNNKRNERTKPIPKQSHSSLRINRVSYSTRGVFRCVATNFAGRVTKEFHITVLEAKSWTATIVFVISSILTVVLMGGIIYLLRRLYKDRQEINQLTSVNFQPGGATRNNTRTGGGGAGGGGISFGIGASSSSAMSSTTASSNSTSRYQQHHNDDDSFHNSIGFDNGKMTNNLIDAF